MRKATAVYSGLFIGAICAALAIAGYVGKALAAPGAGSLVRASQAAVYYLGSDGKRYVFPNEKVYFSWYADFSQVQKISDAELASYTIGGNVTYRPGVKMVKVQSDPKVYAVAKGGVLRWVASEAAANSLFGAAWASAIDDIPDAFFVNYTIGSPIQTAADYAPSQEKQNDATIDVDKSLSSGQVSVGCSSSGATTTVGQTVYRNSCINTTTVRTYGCANSQLTTAESACGSGMACANGACVAASTPSSVAARVFVIDHMDVCFVGDQCTGGDCCNMGGTSFQMNDNFIAVRPVDKYLYANKQQYCATSTLSKSDKDKITTELTNFSDFIASNTQNKLNLGTQQTHLSGEFTMSRVPGSCNWQVAVPDIKPKVLAMTDSSTDFVFGIGSIFFNGTEILAGTNYRSTTQGQGINGAAYSYIAINPNSDEPLSNSLIGAWGQQFVSALNSGITDPLGTAAYSQASDFPACKAAATAYFPSLDACNLDPDYAQCGSAGCSSLSSYRSHVLQSHYNPAWKVVGNHCKDGKKDIDETGIDCGGADCATCPL